MGSLSPVLPLTLSTCLQVPSAALWAFLARDALAREYRPGPGTRVNRCDASTRSAFTCRWSPPALAMMLVPGAVARDGLSRFPPHPAWIDPGRSRWVVRVRLAGKLLRCSMRLGQEASSTASANSGDSRSTAARPFLSRLRMSCNAPLSSWSGRNSISHWSRRPVLVTDTRGGVTRA